MKKVFLVIALVASMMQFADAQGVKSASAAKSSVESAKAAAENPKKNTKPQTWLKYAQTLVEAYNSSVGNAWRGAKEADLKLINADMKPLSVEYVEVAGNSYSRQQYSTSAVYINQAGVVDAIEITRPIVPNALEQAVTAIESGVAVDVKGQKTADFKKLLEDVQTKFSEEAIWAYTIGNKDNASHCFEMAAKAAATAPLSTLDTISIYNAGITASESSNAAKAKEFFKTCLEHGYFAKDGDVYARLSAFSLTEGDTLSGKKYLVEGFQKFPNSQVICVNLINLYLKTGEDPKAIFDLLAVAKNNDPKNASLYYVEGDIHKKLGDLEGAIASYRQSQEVDPTFEWGYIGEGQAYMQIAEDANKAAADELNDEKYYTLIETRDNNYLSSIVPFEKAYEVTKDATIKNTLADQLKSIFYVFSSKSDEYMAKYQKYDAIVKASKQ